MALSDFKREDYLYHPYYCEENIWHLCQNELLRSSYAIFIASKGDAFPMLNQTAMRHSSQPIYWDYHVILLLETEENHILDFDTSLPFASDVETYFRFSFLDENLLQEEEVPLFKVIPATEYVRAFSSDRSHMIIGDEWCAPPPDWPAIGESASTFSDFIDMSNTQIGEVLTQDELLVHFS